MTCSPSAPQWKSLAFLIWVSQVAELTLPLQNQVPALLSRENNLHFINWELRELKKKPHRVCKNSKIQPNWCENCWKYASCNLLFMPPGQWCSKGNFASLQQQNWWIRVKPVVHYLSPHEHTLGRKAVFHSLCQRMCPVWALCWLKGSLHCWERHGPRLPEEVQKLQQPKKGVPMSVCKFKQHKDSSRAAQSVFVPCHPLDPVFPFSSLLVQVQQLKKVFNIWAEPDIPLSRTVPQKPTQGPCVCY